MAWPSRSTLFVADVHLGKASAFRSLGVPVPTGSSRGSLTRLSHCLRRSGAERLVLLGDLWHARSGMTEDLLHEFAVWRREHASVELVLVRGNHDLKSGPMPARMQVEEIPEGEVEGPFVLCHYPCESLGGYVLSGHIHPAVTLEGPGRQSMTLPCFWFSETTGVLPSFGEFTGSARIRPSSGDQVLIVADGRVIRPATPRM